MYSNATQNDNPSTAENVIFSEWCPHFLGSFPLRFPSLVHGTEKWGSGNHSVLTSCIAVPGPLSFANFVVYKSGVWYCTPITSHFKMAAPRLVFSQEIEDESVVLSATSREHLERNLLKQSSILLMKPKVCMYCCNSICIKFFFLPGPDQVSNLFIRLNLGFVTFKSKLRLWTLFHLIYDHVFFKH